jgi:hypothetical protein
MKGRIEELFGVAGAAHYFSHYSSVPDPTGNLSRQDSGSELRARGPFARMGKRRKVQTDEPR